MSTKKIDRDLFLNYSFLAELDNLDGHLLFNEYKQDPQNNTYKVRLHSLDLNTNEDKVLTSWLERNSFFILDGKIYTLRPDEKYTGTTLSVLNENEASFYLPLSLNKIQVLDEENYLVSATTSKLYPDYHTYDDDKKEKIRKEKEENRDYFVFDEYPFFFNGQGIINNNRNSLFLVDKKTLATKKITADTMDVESYDIDNGRIIFSGSDFDTFKGKFSKVFEIDLTTLKTKTLYDGDMQIQRVFVDDGEVIVIGTFGKDYGAIESGKIYRLCDGKMELVVDCEYSFYNSTGSDCRFGQLKNFYKSKDGAYLISTSKADAIVLKYHKHKLAICLQFDGTSDDMTVVDDKLYVIAMKGQKLQEVYDSDLNQLTAINEEVLKDRYVAVPQKVVLNKQTPVEGWVLLPKDYDPKKTYPAILDIHGGPKCAYGEIFYHEMQYWASEGYLVMFCNPRGSDGYGNEFADLRHNFGKIDYEDLLDFVDLVSDLYPVDQNRLCVTGGSYGGYMTNWIITHTDRFKAAASQRSIANWISMVCASDYGIDFPIEQEFADLYNCEKELWDMSPLKYANNAKTPTLFIHSTEDYRCPICEGIQLYTVLKCRGVETKLVGFIGENHELSRSGKPLHRIKRLKEITEWLNDHTK